MMAIFLLGPRLMGLVVLVSGGMLFWGAAMIALIIELSKYRYLGMCIHESALGERRAPDLLALGDEEQGWFALAGEAVLILLGVVICLGPAVGFALLKHDTGARFWLSLVVGLFFLPMVMLSIVMFESFSGLNPFRMVFGIAKTFVSYCVTAMVLAVPVGALILIRLSASKAGPLIAFFADAAVLYMLLVACHILGRYYHRNEDRLDWF